MTAFKEKAKALPYSEPIGLTRSQAERRHDLSGSNRIDTGRKHSAAAIFAGQFRDLMVMILLIAAGVSVIIGEYANAIPIAAIVVLNALLGFIQEYRAEKTLEKLAELTAPTARAWRDGSLTRLPAEELVVGDVIELEAGDRVPADCLILSSKGLCCDESLLTGESCAVEKRPGTGEAVIGEPNLPYMVYMGTICLKGKARAEVTAIGRHTQMGAVSDMIGSASPDETPLQKRLGELGKILAAICIAVCVLVFFAGILRGERVLDMLMTSISIAVAAIPEGLPAAVTIALALAVRRMLARNALVTGLHSVETLGCASVICTDKTGTLTQNRMTVDKLVVCGERDTALGISDSGALTDSEGNPLLPGDNAALKELLCCAAVCNDARLEQVDISDKRDRGGETSGLRAFGDPTECALLEAALRAGTDAESLRLARTDEQPFDSANRYMTVTVKTAEGEERVYKKGAPDVVLGSARWFLGQDGTMLPLGEARAEAFSGRTEALASDGMRVLGFSVSIDGKEALLGLAAMTDPLRPEARKAVRECQKAGIRTVMITGDHKLTACAAARDAGILKDGMRAFTGAELDRMSDDALDDALDAAAVFARVSPEHKLRIVRAFKRRKKVCAMTGDGVNDAPAVKEASIGVAMGLNGTDVTKQAADCVLLDDNFATLVSAVEEGRTIYGNIRKFVRYLISCNIGEILTMLCGMIMGLPQVLLPAQLLLVNLVTDGLPAIALGVEPSEKGVMERPPRGENESFFSGGLLGRMLLRGAFIGLATLASFTVLLSAGSGLTAARTGALATLVISQLIHVFECKSETEPLHRIRLRNNPFMIFSVLLSLACLLGCITVPPLAEAFALTKLGASGWLICGAFAAAPALLGALVRR